MGQASFFERWRARHGAGSGPAAGEPAAADPQAVAALLAECELLREQASAAGVALDDTPASLEALDQLVPRWRDDPERQSWLGHDAGLYLGTVIVRTVPGAVWQVWPDGRPVVRLSSGREIDVVAAGETWAAGGSPELTQVYAEAAEGA